MAVTRDAETRPVSNPALSEYLDQLESLVRDTRELVDGLSSPQVNWRPRDRGWSIGQCLDHLTRTTRGFLPRIELALEESRSRKNRGAKGYRDGLFAAWLIRRMEPPPGLRIRTLKAMEPASELDARAVLADFLAVHGRLGDLMVAADGVSLSHGRMVSPFVRLYRLTLRQAFAVNLAHGRRHLWQARLVRTHPSFPLA